MNAFSETSAVTLARSSFDAACTDLDAAVMSLGDVDGDTVMADAHLIGLLIRVANARQHLADVTSPTTP
jgi:hypothetical protein